MQMADIRAIAKEHGVKVGKLAKAELIRAIQRTEGNFDCFGTTSDGQCDQMDCRWRDDCLSGVKAKKS